MSADGRTQERWPSPKEAAPLQRRQSPKTLQPAGLGGEALTGLVPEGGGTGCRAKLPQETLSWKMCGPITLLGRGGGGGEKSASKNGRGAAQGAAAVSSDGSLALVPGPVTRGGWGDAGRQPPPQVDEEQELFLPVSLHPTLRAPRTGGGNARLG